MRGHLRGKGAFMPGGARQSFGIGGICGQKFSLYRSAKILALFGLERFGRPMGRQNPGNKGVVSKILRTLELTRVARLEFVSVSRTRMEHFGLGRALVKEGFHMCPVWRFQISQ